MEITCLKEDIGWVGVLPSPSPHCNKRHHTAKPTKNRVEGSYASTKLMQLKTKYYYWFNEGGNMKIAIALDI